MPLPADTTWHRRFFVLKRRSVCSLEGNTQNFAAAAVQLQQARNADGVHAV